VVEFTHLKEIHHAAGTAAFGIGTSEDNPPQAGMDDGPGAHRAGFFCDIQVAVRESPITHRCLGLRDGEHFCMGGGILEHFDLIPSAGDDFSFAHHDGSDWHLVGR